MLFLALEDNRRRMQRRTTKLLGAHKADWPHIATYHKWPRADQGGADALRKWMLDYPATRLIVVDVLARFRKPSPPGKQSYELDYEAVVQLQSIAAENAGLAIIVVHHLRKSEAGDDVLDTVSGTLGTNAAADAIVILHKTAQGMSLDRMLTRRRRDRQGGLVRPRDQPLARPRRARRGPAQRRSASDPLPAAERGRTAPARHRQGARPVREHGAPATREALRGGHRHPAEVWPLCPRVHPLIKL